LNILGKRKRPRKSNTTNKKKSLTPPTPRGTQKKCHSDKQQGEIGNKKIADGNHVRREEEEKR